MAIAKYNNLRNSVGNWVLEWPTLIRQNNVNTLMREI